VNTPRGNRVRPAALCAASCVIVMLGCGERLPPMHDAGGFDIGRFGGAVDGSLPSEVQKRQGVLRDMLNTLVGGTRVEDLPDEMPGVRFVEPADEFYRGGLQLRRWDFTGPPQAGAYPVRLEFMVDDVKKIDRTDHRSFKVTGQPGKWTIAPADSSRGR
jgi:hypothetical protein